MADSALTLGELVDLQRGTTYKSALLGTTGPVLLGLASIQRDGGFRSDSLRNYSGESPEKLLLRPGDLFVSLKDVTQSGDLLGSVARVPPSIELGRLTQDTVKLCVKPADFPRNYLYWALRSPEYREYCRAHAIGTTNLSLSRDDFFAFQIPAPSAARLQLVSLLEELEEKIDLNRRMNETLEAMARALFKSWFVEFDPVRAKAEGRAPAGMDAATSALFPSRLVETAKGEVPEGWSIAELGEVADLNPESWARNTYPSAIRYVDLAAAKWGTISDIGNFARDAAPSRAQRILRRGDTIVGTVRPGNGSYALVDEDGLTGSTGFAVLRARHLSRRAVVYLAATARENIDRLAHFADGGAYPAVRPELVGATPLVECGAEVGAAFECLVGPLLDRASAARKESAVLAAIRDALLPRLLSGEVRVDTRPITIEDAA